jgi:hypothetical protein
MRICVLVMGNGKKSAENGRYLPHFYAGIGRITTGYAGSRFTSNPPKFKNYDIHRMRVTVI